MKSVSCENRGEKEYSMTDCISMNVMTAESLVEALAHDHNFRQENSLS